MKNNGGVVQVAKISDTEAIDDHVRHQENSVDPNGLASRGFVATFDSCCRGNESSTSKGDAGRHCDLAEKIEPGDS